MPNKIARIWTELKRRRVHRLMAIYAGSAYVIFEASTLIFPRWGLPDWSIDLVLYLLILGAIVTFVLGWIYDLTPDGIQKTGSVSDTTTKETSPTPNGWKIASHISLVVIVVLIILNFIPRAGKSEILDKSIAVLPFTNLSTDEENTYFIDGVMESILDNLCKIEDLRVPGRTSVMQYRENPKPISIVAEEMDVSYVVEGSGQKIGNRLLLTVQLIIGNEDRHIWSKQYDRVIEQVEDLIDLQKEIAQLVAGEIEAIITPEEKELLENVPTTSLTAYDFYQQGMGEFEGNNIEKAEQLFHEAVQYDSTFAQAYVGLAMVYWSQRYWETVLEEDFLDSVLILANKALAIDNRLSDAYSIKGKYYMHVGETERAIEEFDRAIQLNPNNGMAYLFAGELYAQIDLVKSIQYYHKTLELNRGDELPAMLDNLALAYLPSGHIDKSRYYYSEAFKLTKDSMHYYDRLSFCEFVNEDFPLAIKYLSKAYAFDTTDYHLHSFFGEYYMMNGDFVQSLKHFNQWLDKGQLRGQNALFGMHRVGWAYWMNGLKEEGEDYFMRQIDYCNRILEMGRVIGSTFRNYYDLAATYAFIGEKDKALSNLRIHKKYITGNRWGVMYFKNDPLFDSIRDEPEFQQIVREVEAKYQAEHERVRQWLEENDML